MQMIECERQTVQRTEHWYAFRKKYPEMGSASNVFKHPVNASSFSKMVFGTNAERARIWAWHRGLSDAPPGPGQGLQEGLEWGTNLEPCALVTYLHCKVKRLGGDAKFYETGLWRLGRMGDILDFVADSPDGYVIVGGRMRAVEFKCPFWQFQGQCPATDPDCRASYILQVHLHMKAIGARVADLLSWDPFSSTIFEIHFPDELWGMMEKYLLMSKASLKRLQKPAI
jgi:hypothetical protein